jgi:hypothetical protein
MTEDPRPDLQTPPWRLTTRLRATDSPADRPQGARDRARAVLGGDAARSCPLRASDLLDTYLRSTSPTNRQASPARQGVLVGVFSLAGTSGLRSAEVLYTGLLDAIVGAHQFGRPEEPLLQRLRNLPTCA